MKTNFPRITEHQQHEVNAEVLAEIFPWGCSLLPNYPKIDLDESFCKVLHSSSIGNIYKAIKYGIWTTKRGDFAKSMHNF